jgi:hypothetical protein
MRTNEFFAQQAKVSTETMENLTVNMADVAMEARKESNSMHIITIFTLIFLPGTFVAVRYGVPYLGEVLPGTLTAHQTFFSSGILNFDGYEGDLPMVNMVGFNTKWAALKLFGAICIPMTVTTLTIWGIFYFLAWRQSNRNRTAGNADNGELEKGHQRLEKE